MAVGEHRHDDSRNSQQQRQQHHEVCEGLVDPCRPLHFNFEFLLLGEEPGIAGLALVLGMEPTADLFVLLHATSERRNSESLTLKN